MTSAVTTPSLVPLPVSMLGLDGPPFTLTSDSRLVSDEKQVVGWLAGVLRGTTGLELPQVPAVDATPGPADIVVELLPAAELERAGIAEADQAEGYQLRADAAGLRLGAATPAGLFRGAQTLRQLLPVDPGATPSIPPVVIVDHPRFAYRGASLDVARHFFAVADVEKYLDALALVKISHLHLHLTDDQGWRLRIDAWPLLTAVGASTAVGGAPGGYYTKADYTRIVEYAASLFITIVPEIDLPGHTHAVATAYPRLGAGGQNVEPYEGVEVGFSSLAIDEDETYRFVADVLSEVAALTPGQYLHVGGDESLATDPSDYASFISRVAGIAASTGKTVIGWHEMGAVDTLPRGTIGQYWSFTTPQEGATEKTASFVRQGGRIIMSPADAAYLDIAYPDPEAGREHLGQLWTGRPTSLERAFDWEPTAVVPGIGEAEVLGVEAAIWTETLGTIEEVEYLAFPRLASIAEIGWSPRRADGDSDAVGRHLERLADLCTRLDALGVAHRAPVAPAASAT